MKCCSRTAAASASTSSRRPRVVPPCSRIAPSARAVLIRSSHISTGSPVRRAIVVGQLAGRQRALAVLRALAGERQSDHDADRAVLRDQLQEPWHGEALARAAHERLQRGRENLGVVAQREADAHVAPVHGEQAAGRGSIGEFKRTETAEKTPSSPRSYCAIVAKNSLLFFVRFIRSSRNSSASTGGMSARKLRSR